ncbi:hypothetical protein IAU59_001527 [Kwoniella sp. CBS 9459]
MSEVATENNKSNDNLLASSSAPEQSKKRKRTGKEREERKRLAIQAQKDAEEAARAGQTSTVDETTGAPEVFQGESSSAAAAAVAPSEPAGSAETVADGKRVVDVEKAIKRVPQALKTLHPVFKQAKTFETRRLIKKVKFLRTKPDAKAELADLEGQLAILHDVQLHSLAQTHLLLKLRKHPSFKHTSLASDLTDLLTPPNSNATATSTSISTSAVPALVGKVENRLCSAKSVADVIKGVVSWVVGEEGAKLNVVKASKEKKEGAGQLGPKGKSASKIRSDAHLVEVDSDGDDGGLDDIYEGSRNMVVGSDEEDGGSDEEDDEDRGAGLHEDLAADAAGWESGSIGGNDLDDISDDEAGSDSDAIDIPPTKKSKSLPTAASSSASSSKQPKPKAQKVEKGDITSSMFLPSLATGFTRGDEDDSDPDMDYDPDGVIGKQGVVRKNRRGQRARQAIWEKKYGKNAKHVVKARTEEETKSAHKAQREFDKRGKPEGMKGRDGGWGNRSGRPTFGPGPAAAGGAGSGAPRPKAQEEQKKNLHPSWEAARLRKQKMGAVPAPGAAKPNKIVFD